jgi:hypothetical protein
MSLRTLVYSLVALAVLIPGSAAAGTTITISATNPVAGGSQGTVICSFQCTAGGMSFCGTSVDRFVFTSSVGGSFPQGGTTQTVMVASSTTSATASIAWTAPSAAGAATLTCAAANATATVAGPTSTAVTVTAPAPLAPVISELAAPSPTFAGSPNALTATATDPAGLPITYSWSATGGSFEPAAPTGPGARWTAPAAAGSYVVEVTATNSSGASSRRSAVVDVVLSVFQASLDASMRGPTRLAATEAGDLFVSDGSHRLVMLTRQGQLRGAIRIGGGVTAVGAAGGVAYVGTHTDGIVRIDSATGRIVGSIPHRFSSGPDGIAIDAARGRVWVVGFTAGRATALQQDGATVLRISTASSRPLRFVTDVAFDAVRDELWLAERAEESGPMVHAYRGADGAFLRSYVIRGSAPGEVMSVGGIAAEGGKLFVSDAFTGTVQVLAAATGESLGSLGQKGIALGDLNQPRGLAVLPNGDLAVANSALDRIDRFGTGSPLPVCEADADCDGLPDDWELASGLDPADPSDGLTDPDADGLSNAEEYALGTDPRSADTDGDGFADGVEVATGFDPLVPGDHRAVLTATGSPGGPGLVRLSGSIGGLPTAVACDLSWQQTSGPEVELRDAASLAPTFIARSAGGYGFALDGVCDGVPAQGATVEVVVDNVAPQADAGRVVVADLGSRIRMSGSDSTDANGDALAFTWEQASGPAVTGGEEGVSFSARFSAAGAYSFALTAADAGASSTVEAGVVVVGPSPAPTASVVTPVVASVGQVVTLDASESFAPGGSFAWQQVAGAAVSLSNAATSRPSFLAPAAGRFAFEVSVQRGAIRSRPSRVDVFVASAGVDAPRAVASAPGVVAVNSAVTLDGSASTGTGTLVHAWRQLSGPAAGLRNGDQARAEVVFFEPGSYLFELSVADGGAVAVPATVRVEARAGGRPIPVARVSAPPEAVVDQIVILDGKGSSGAKSYRWTQVAGPWVVVKGGGRATFVPPAAGRYGFELEVNDGSVRSAPAAVTIDVR